MTNQTKDPDMVYLSAAMKLSALLGRKFGVRVIFGGHPSTNGTEIVLPFWDLSTVEARNALYGCVAHEAGGHIRMTDFDVVARACDKVQPSYRLTFKSVLNILEDVRIEAALMREYRGVGMYLDAVAARYILSEPPAPDPSHYWGICMGWLLHMGRCELLRQMALHGHLYAYEKAILDHQILGQADLHELRCLAAPVARLGASRACTFQMIDAAMRVFDHLKKREQHQALSAPVAQPPQGDSGTEGQQSNEGNDPQASSGPQTGQDVPQGQPDPQGDDNGSQGSSDPQAGTDGPQGQPDPQQDRDVFHGASTSPDGAGGAAGHDPAAIPQVQPTDTSPLSQERGDVVGEAIRSEARQADPALTPFEGLGAGPDYQGPVTNAVPVADFLRDATGLIGRYAVGLAPLLVGDVHADVSLRSGRHLDARRLARVAAEPEPAVFRRRLIDEDTAVAVQLLVDTSGSTRDTDNQARHTIHRHLLVSSLALVGALEAFPDVDVGMACFPHRHDRSILTVKSMRSTLSGRSKASLPSGGTPLGAAMQQAGLELLVSERPRRMLFVLTDGQPDCARQAEEARGVLGRLGIEVYGLVIGNHTHYPREVFDDSVMVHDAASLPLALETMVKRLI